jgi:predicted HicB family RNase H-like nuclease
MINVIDVDGEKAVVAFDPDLQMFRGEFVGLTGGADFYADTVQGLLAEARTSLSLYLELCREKGLEPRRQFSGKFNVRLPPADHAAAVLAAQAEGKSLNEWIVQAIQRATGTPLAAA